MKTILDSRKSKIVVYGLSGLFVVLQVYLFFFMQLDVRDDFKYINEVPVPLFGKTKQVSQGFRVPGPLARIDILMANYKIKPEAGTLQLGIYQKNRCLYVKNKPANTVEDNRFYSFRPETGKIGKGLYEMRLSFDQKNKNDRLAVWTSKKNLYPHGHLLVNGNRVKGDMTFRVYYSSTIWKEKHRWLHSITGVPMRGVLLALVLLVMLGAVNYFLFFALKRLIGYGSQG